ncbi:hypothetical protein ACIXOD_11510 [Bacteroides fragilis]
MIKQDNAGKLVRNLKIKLTMKTLQISEQKARELYKSGSSELKSILEESFGKDFFSQKITDRVKTYEDACRELSTSPLDENKLMKLGLTKHDIAYQKLVTIIKALNEGWIPDVCDSSVYRWYPWFKTNGSPSSFAFCDSIYVIAFASAGSGSRLKFRTRELANYAVEQFIDIWKDIQIG